MPPDPNLPRHDEMADDAEPGSVELSPEDFYLEGESLIFTAEFHRKRGFCCNSGCRHCPYRRTSL